MSIELKSDLRPRIASEDEVDEGIQSVRSCDSYDESLSERRGFRLAIKTPPIATPPRREVQEEIERIHWLHASAYFFQFDIDRVDLTIDQVLGEKFEGSKLDIRPINHGVSEGKIIIIDGVCRYVLKKVALPERLFCSDWPHLEQSLRFSRGEKLSARVQALLTETPNMILTQEFPSMNTAQREKIAAIIGRLFGVPSVQVIRSSSAIFTLHEFVPNNGTTRGLDLRRRAVQSRLCLDDIQRIGIFDILTENQDRNLDNILVTKSPKEHRSNRLHLIPIDHALCFQRRSVFLSTSFGEYHPPCWLHWEKADSKLSRKVLSLIQSLDSEKLIAQILQEKVILDAKVAESLRKNVLFLQCETTRNPMISLKELYKRFIAQ